MQDTSDVTVQISNIYVYNYNSYNSYYEIIKQRVKIGVYFYYLNWVFQYSTRPGLNSILLFSLFLYEAIHIFKLYVCEYAMLERSKFWRLQKFKISIRDIKAKK